MDFNRLEGPFYPNKIFSEKTDQASQTSSKSLTFYSSLSSLASPITPAHFKITKADIEDPLLQELEQRLHIQATEIEQELKELEKNKSDFKVIKSTLEIETWGKWAQKSVDTTSEIVQDGLEFLHEVLPPDLLTHIPHASKFEQLNHLTFITGTFLNALNTGSQGIALIYREKILKQAKELFHHFQTIYTEKNSHLSPEELKRFSQKLAQWELDLKLKEKSLIEEKLHFKLNALSTSLAILKFPLTYIPNVASLKPTQMVLSGISWILAALEVITTGFELKKSTQTKHRFNQWVHSYQKWQEQHQPQFKITENDVQRECFSPSSVPPILTDEQHEHALFQFLNQAQDLTQIRNHMKTLEIEVNSSLQSKQEFLDDVKKNPDYRAHLVQAYINFQRTLEALNIISHTSANLLAKREAIIQKKILLLKPHFLVIEAQLKAMPRAQLDKEPKAEEDLLRLYIDHQETLEHTVKNSLKQMIKQKHDIESRFLTFKHVQAGIQFGVALIVLTISVILAILGLLSLPFGGAGLILILLSFGSITISLGLLGASYFQAYHEKPYRTQAFSISYQAQLTWARLRTAIHHYLNQTKEKKLLEVAAILHQLHSSTSLKDKQDNPVYQKALANYKNAKLNFEKNQQNIAHWTQRMNRLENHLIKKSWQDFARQASLTIDDHPTAFDTLRAFQEALQACDLYLLSEETKTLLFDQLGLDLEALQTQIQKNPEVIKKNLQEFFALDDAGLVSFITKAQLKAGMIKG